MGVTNGLQSYSIEDDIDGKVTEEYIPKPIEL
jgi:hypothetical protein